MDGFGVPILKTNYWDECFHRNKAGQMGIPMDSADNQLKEWIYNSRKQTLK
jgi:hypothetical protein